MKAVLGIAASAAAAFAMAPASATVALPTTTYNFTGTCTDCVPGGTAQATATLVLTGYTPGTALDPSNFVSFSYHSPIEDFDSSTGVIGTFEVEHDLSGNLKGDGRSYDVNFDEYVFIFNTNFNTSSDGTWSFTQNEVDLDHGTNGVWTGAVPEPATWAMMIGGFGLVGGLMRAARKSDERFTRKLRKLASD